MTTVPWRGRRGSGRLLRVCVCGGACAFMCVCVCILRELDKPVYTKNALFVYNLRACGHLPGKYWEHVATCQVNTAQQTPKHRQHNRNTHTALWVCVCVCFMFRFRPKEHCTDQEKENKIQYKFQWVSALPSWQQPIPCRCVANLRLEGWEDDITFWITDHT